MGRFSFPIPNFGVFVYFSFLFPYSSFLTSQQGISRRLIVSSGATGRCVHLAPFLHPPLFHPPLAYRPYPFATPCSEFTNASFTFVCSKLLKLCIHLDWPKRCRPRCCFLRFPSLFLVFYYYRSRLFILFAIAPHFTFLLLLSGREVPRAIDRLLHFGSLPFRHFFSFVFSFYLAHLLLSSSISLLFRREDTIFRPFCNAPNCGSSSILIFQYSRF